MPAVSVLMPVLNSEGFVREAIESIVAQSFYDLELLIWDDGSSDETLRICYDAAEFDDRIRIFHGERRGISAALNSLIEVADSAICARMDGDDIALPCRIEDQLAYFKRDRNLGILGSKVRLIGRKAGYWNYRQTDSQTKALALIGNTALCHPSWMVRREIFQSFSYDTQFDALEDCEWLARVLFQTDYNAYSTNEVLLHYRIHKKNVSVNKHKLQKTLRKRVLSKIWNDHGITFTPYDVEVFCEYLHEGKSFSDQTRIMHSIEKLTGQLNDLNESVKSEVMHRLNHCKKKEL